MKHCIGITGTNGKTTTSYCVRHILRSAGHRVGLLGTIEYDFGNGDIVPARLTTPSPTELATFLQKMEANGCTHLVMEVSSHGLQQGRTQAIPFSIAAFLNLTPDHLDYHKTLDNYFAAKCKLFQGPKHIVLNADDARSAAIPLSSQQQRLTFGVRTQADFFAHSIQCGLKSTSFTLVHKREYACNIPLVGAFNVENCMAALAICTAEGIPLEHSIEALKSFKGVPGRIEQVLDRPIFIDFAHTPDGLKKLLQTFRALPYRRILLVFGCGGDRDKTKRPHMMRIAHDAADALWVTSDNPRTEAIQAIFDDMRHGISLTKPVIFDADRANAIQSAIDAMQPDDVLLIAGKGHEAYQIIGDQKIPFSDRTVVLNALQRSPEKIEPQSLAVSYRQNGLTSEPKGDIKQRST
ncbi:MAG: hypothetical protein A2Y14_00675 [Verrucomicrobia bacterium GWF2_51_19]|nr:MAG: hypothetical protein A2Y14_00675 [Verrucomicrobia bacterium GWF2_51_19]HCJ12435.1 UDP-N-acetylmuramoyl-L-alanyl-D-glutamate--2,6-diaminopimelate ligase [Opitutae bacterium]